MSTLHERLLAEPDIWTREAQSDPTGAVDRLAAAVRAVVELHAPHRPLGGSIDECPQCSDPGRDRTLERASLWAPWPCTTVKIVARELGVETGETP